MSDAYYNELWLLAGKDMEKLLRLDRSVRTSKSPKSNDVALNAVLPIYLKYRDLVNRLILCHDQIIQPQKRELTRQLLDCSIGRMLEYDRQIAKLESNNYRWLDEFMIKMKMTPSEMAFPVPTSYAADRKIFLQQRRKYIEDSIAKAETTTNASDDEGSGGDDDERRKERGPSSDKIDVSDGHIEDKLEEKTARDIRDETGQRAFENAILMIETHERARAARCIGIQAEREYVYKKKIASGEIKVKKTDGKVKNKAAIVIQKYWRGHASRKSFDKRIDRIEAKLDMTIQSWKNSAMFRKDKDNYERRVSLRVEAVETMAEITSAERGRMLRIRGPGLVEDITDEIGEWFLLWYNELGYFDAYPASEAGGTILVATGRTLTPEEYLVDRWQKNAKKSEKNQTTDPVKKPLKNGNEPVGESKVLEALEVAENEFVQSWRFRESSSGDRRQVYLDLIDEKLLYELQLEMRQIADELMRLELSNLNEALKKDHEADKDKFTIPTMVKAKNSKKKRRKNRGKKDPLSGVANETIFNELVRAKIIHNYPEEHLDDWQTDLSYENFEARFQNCINQVKDSVIKYCVLPLGSRQVHAMAPLVRSVCICGMPRYGKSFLANAICTEVGALLFDLTPRVLVGRYEGKKNEQKLMNIIGKLAREYAPSIVFIDGGDKPWWKKIPVAERYTQPKRLAKILPKFVKSIKSGDQVLFLTLATEPYRSKKGFLKIHEKLIIIPITDYNTLYMFYKNLLIKYHGIDRNIDVSCLAKVSVGYPLEFIRETVENIMDPRRRLKLRFQPLDPREILAKLLEYDGPASKTVEQFKKFQYKTLLGKNRQLDNR